MRAVSVLTSRTPRSMPTSPPKPIILISYACADEPEEPAEGEVQWLSFVTGHLRPAEEIGAFEIWTEPLAPDADARSRNPAQAARLRYICPACFASFARVRGRRRQANRNYP